MTTIDPTDDGRDETTDDDTLGLRYDGHDHREGTAVSAYADAEPVLELSGVRQEYGPETAVDGVDLVVREGELLTLLGPSGCGKTTTLRLIAGLDVPTDGTVQVAGETVAGAGEPVPPEERDVGMVFQEFALFPHLTVAENVAFGIDDWPAEDRERRVEELLELVGLEEYGDRSPTDLSGGQRQRVALARSLAPEPDVLLLDEPFSNLDVRLRTRMREEVRRILKSAGVTAVSVTHDQEEALSISDRVAVVDGGQIEQVGRPETVFEHPESRFVAEFIGQASFLTGTFSEGRVATGLGTFRADMLQGLTDDYDGAEVDVLVRPDDLRASPVEESNGGDGTVVGREYTGPSFVYDVELDSGDLVRCEHNHASEFGLDRRVRVDLVADHTLAWYPAD
ncbi:ABC transporter ATP-binding protein [Halobaculum sp. MBLA0143]|uniref:ABC transporter ATP-binding protein n=1 Tax=Halobaculum sp. MBLA0143 TaxID=3079933 RepID=UPI0035231BF2